LKGVTKAVKDPRNFVFAAMDFSQHLAAKPPLKPLTGHSYRVWCWDESPKPPSKILAQLQKARSDAIRPAAILPR